MSSEEFPKSDLVTIPKSIVRFTDDGIPYVPPFGDNRIFWCLFREDEDKLYKLSKCHLPEDNDEDSCGFDWMVDDAEDEIEVCEVYGSEEKAKLRLIALNKNVAP